MGLFCALSLLRFINKASIVYNTNYPYATLIKKWQGIDMTNKIAQVNFRLPQSLKDQLEEAATTNDRSTTSELINRLQASFDNEVKYGDVRDAYSKYNQARLSLIDAINRDDLALRDSATLNTFN